MRRRRVLPAAAGAVAAASLLLTACGGGDDGGSDDKIEGVQDEPSKSPSPSASEAGVERPEIKLPSYAKMVFEDGETGDPEKDAVLRDSAERFNALYDAILKGDPNSSPLSFYSSGEALSSSRDFIQGWVDKGDKWAGVIRVFDRQVTLREQGSAVVIFCSDESGAVISKTPEKERNLPSGPGVDNAYVLYNTLLQKNETGVWQTVKGVSKRGAEQCRA